MSRWAHTAGACRLGDILVEAKPLINQALKLSEEMLPLLVQVPAPTPPRSQSLLVGACGVGDATARWVS